MIRKFYRYKFDSKIPIGEVEQSLLLAVLAAENLHGRSLVRLDASFRFDAQERLCVVDAATEVGHSIARIFTGFLAQEFGDESFKVERVGGSFGTGPDLKTSGTKYGTFS